MQLCINIGFGWITLSLTFSAAFSVMRTYQKGKSTWHARRR